MSAGPVAKKPFLKRGGGVDTKSRGVSGKTDAKKAEDQARLSAKSARTADIDASRSERLGTAGMKGAAGGANAKAPGGKDGFKPGTSVKDRIAAWEGGTGGGGGAPAGPAAPAAKKPFLKKGGGVATPQNGGAPKKADMSAHQSDVKAAGKVAGSDLDARRSARENRAKPWQQNAKNAGGAPTEQVAPKDVVDGPVTKPEPEPDPILDDKKKKPSPEELDKKLDEGKSDPSLWDRIKEWVGGLFGKKDMSPSEVAKVEEQEKVVAPEPQPDPGPAPVGPDSIPEIRGPDVPGPTNEDTVGPVDVTGGGGGGDITGDLKGRATGALDDASGALGDAVSQGETAVGDKVGDLEDQASTAIKGAEDTVSGKVGELEGQAGAAIKGAEDTVSGKVGEAEDAVGAKVEEAEGAVAEKWKESPARAMAAKLIGADNMDKVDAAIAGGYKELKGKAKKKYEKMKKKAAARYAKLKEKGGELYQGAKDKVADKYQELKGRAGDLYQGAKDKVKGAWDGAKGFAKKLKFW